MKMVDLSDSKKLLSFLAVLPLFLSLIGPSATSALGNPVATIKTEDFRWTRFPINVLVDMNQWSTVNYSISVHEALNSWLHSIWNYTNNYGSNLPNVNYTFRVSNLNASSNYDVLITFAPDEIYPNTGVVGVTETHYDQTYHVPTPPIIINVTTYHDTAYDLFVKNVAMHEFGHVLGLGHASSSTTSNGPELMYNRSSKDEITYPSTLDIYALTQLYHGYYNQDIQLPNSMPYFMLSDGSIPPPSLTIWEAYFQDLVIAAILVVAIVVTLTIWWTLRKPEQPAPPPPPPAVESPQSPSAAP